MAERFEEGVGHAAADDEGVHLVDQVGDHADFIRNLRTAENGDEGTLRVGKRSAHHGDFFLDQVAAHGREMIGNACGGAVCAVR